MHELDLFPTALAQAYDYFLRGEALTSGELQSRLGLSERQVRRLIGRLRSRAVPVRERREGRFKRFFLPADERPVAAVQGLELSEQELFALTVAAEASSAVLEPTPLGRSLQSAFDKLLACTGEAVLSFEPELRAEQWHFGLTGASALDPLVFETVTRCVRECRTLRMDYLTASTGTRSQGRLIDPLIVAVRGSSWLVVARCHQAQQIRDFALAGILKAEATGDFFERPSGFDPELHFRDRFSAVGGEEVYEVRLRVSAQKAPYFRRKVYHPTQQLEDGPEGGLVASYEVAGLDEIAAFIRSWGPGVTVLAPPLLATRVAAEARAVAAAYEPAASEA